MKDKIHVYMIRVGDEEKRMTIRTDCFAGFSLEDVDVIVQKKIQEEFGEKGEILRSRHGLEGDTSEDFHTRNHAKSHNGTT